MLEIDDICNFIIIFNFLTERLRIRIKEKDVGTEDFYMERMDEGRFAQKIHIAVVE